MTKIKLVLFSESLPIFLLSHTKNCYTAYVGHTDAVKPDLRETELLMSFNCWIY